MKKPHLTPNSLTFVSRESDDGPWLRLMVLNPVNDQPSPVLNVIIETDPPLILPGPGDLYTGKARPEASLR